MASPIWVVGAGVSGLTTAFELATAGAAVRILARELPEATTSTVPAALWYPYRAAPRDRVFGWARATFLRLRELGRDPATGVRMATGIEVFRDQAALPWWRDAVDVCREAAPDELPPGVAGGYVFEAPIVETPTYLPWLEARVRALGVAIEPAALSSWEERVPPGNVVVNCSGLGARELAADGTVFASRGQVVHLEPRPLRHFVLDELDPAGITYVIARSDAIVLGTTAEDGDESVAVSEAASVAIVARARRLVPELAGLSVVGARVGIRPCRGEVRLEVEAVAGGRTIVHNYGHGGAGFTLSWGCAREAAALALAADRGGRDLH